MKNFQALADLSRTRSEALAKGDEATADEASEQLMSAIAELLELGVAAPVIAQASDSLEDNFAAVDALHELAQAVVEEDEDTLASPGAARVNRLVLLPLSVSRDSAYPSSEVPAPSQQGLESVSRLILDTLALRGVAELHFVPYVYAGEQLMRASYDHLFNVLPAVYAQQAGEQGLVCELLQERPVPISSGAGSVRYLLGVLNAPVELDADFVVDELRSDATLRDSFPAVAAPLLTSCLEPGWRCLQVMELAPFFEAVTMGEQFGREAEFTMTVLMGLDAARVSPRATMANISMPKEDTECDRVEVQLLGMDSVAVVTAYWDILEPADPDSEVSLLMQALTRIGVRTRQDASVVAGYGTA